MAYKIKCDSCGQNMIVSKDFGTKRRGKKNSLVRLRRFSCELCDLHKLVFADGYVQENPYVKPENLSDNSSV